MKKFTYFSSEFVSPGHPDKVSDQISDAILDACLADDPNSRVACEVFCTTGLVVVGGEITTTTYIDVQEIVRKKINEIGGTKNETSFGSQIRSYVFHPYSLIKDLRTQYEETNVVKVMDGEITGFIDSFLKSEYNRG